MTISFDSYVPCVVVETVECFVLIVLLPYGIALLLYKQPVEPESNRQSNGRGSFTPLTVLTATTTIGINVCLWFLFGVGKTKLLFMSFCVATKSSSSSLTMFA